MTGHDKKVLPWPTPLTPQEIADADAEDVRREKHRATIDKNVAEWRAKNPPELSDDDDDDDEQEETEL